MLTLSFEVHEDLPSERSQDYRQLVIDGLTALLPKATDEQRKMIDRMFWDWDRPKNQQDIPVRSVDEIMAGG
jgi:hypothetical protein